MLVVILLVLPLVTMNLVHHMITYTTPCVFYDS